MRIIRRVVLSQQTESFGTQKRGCAADGSFTSLRITTNRKEKKKKGEKPENAFCISIFLDSKNVKHVNRKVEFQLTLKKNTAAINPVWA